MLIFKSFLFTLPASVRVCALGGLIMRNAQGDAMVSEAIKSVLFELWQCALSSPKVPFLCFKLRSRPREKAGAALVGRGPWGQKLQRENTPWPDSQPGTASWLHNSKISPSIISHPPLPFQDWERRSSQLSPCCPLPSGHRRPLETESEMIASQRKAKLRIHIKTGNQEGRLKAWIFSL